MTAPLERSRHAQPIAILTIATAIASGTEKAKISQSHHHRPRGGMKR